MNKPMSQAEWIDRCAAHMGKHDVGLSPAEALEHASELWLDFAQELAPEEAADRVVGSIEGLENLFFHLAS